MTAPDWLDRHGGALKRGADGNVWFLYFDDKPHYKLIPSPADGQFTCLIAQTENGRRLDKGAVYPTAEDALRSGLEELRAYLGW
jgi:hypothetical protein